MFGPAVEAMLQQELAAAAAKTSTLDNQAFIPVTIEVSQRFIDAMGASLFTSAVLTQLGASVGGAVVGLSVRIHVNQ